MAKHTRRVVLTLLLAAVAGSSRAETCESLQAVIDAKIRATGAVNYTLLTVDLEASDAGRVVGFCGMGSKKIIYRQVGLAAASFAPGAKPRGVVLTECKEGFSGADCSQRSVLPASGPADGKKRDAP